MKYVIILSLIFIVSCIDEVKNDFSTADPSFGISLLLADDGRNISAVIFATAPVNGTTPLEKVQQAKVLLWENDSLVDSLLYNPQNHLYQGKTKPIAGNIYKCKVYLIDGTALSAKTDLPKATPISKWEDSAVYPTVYETEKALPACEFAELIDPVLKHEDIINKVLFSTALMQEETYTMQINFFSPSNINDVYIFLRSVSQEYYEFARSVDRYEQGRFPNILDNPSAYTLYSNIENGKGVFCGYSVMQIGPIKEHY